MTPVHRQIVFINTAHTITHYSLVILPTAVLAMAVPGGPFGSSYGPILALATRHVRVLRPAVAAAGLAGATLRPQDPDDRVLPGRRRWSDRRRSRSFSHHAGHCPGIRRRFRRDLPPNRDDNAGGGRW